MSTSYFSTDGNCGDATGLVIIDTSDWTDGEWAIILSAPDDERSQIAKEISSFSNKDFSSADIEQIV
jgi:hypothetical protein